MEAEMERDRITALTYFLRFLAGNPDGDAATRAMVLGALAPVHISAGQVYAHNGADSLELVGNFGYDDEEAAAFRALPTTLPLPVCDTFNSMRAIVVAMGQLTHDYPFLEASQHDATEAAHNAPGTHMICVPVINSGVPIGAMSLQRETELEWTSDEWQYLDGVTAAVGMWLNNQRSILVDRWRRTAPVPHREVRISDRQRQILELIGNDRTNGEIAKELGYSIPTIKKDLQSIMRILGTQDRRATAGRAREIGLLPERRIRD
ncbi:MAG: response regulator transcription factor [Actinobacteria bacterium]|nr:response regulator transcription factor [Actinomycetota bacterium]